MGVNPNSELAMIVRVWYNALYIAQNLQELIMPSPNDIYTAARSHRDDFNNAKRSGRMDGWGDMGSEGFAIRYGFYTAFKSCGFDVDKAAHFADILASKKSIPDVYIGDRLGENFELYYSHQFNTETQTVAGVFRLLAGGSGRWVEDDEDPRAGLDDPEDADTAVIINLESVRARMLALFNK